MSLTPPSTARRGVTPEDARAFLELTRMLDDVEIRHPELSAPLRLTLLRAHREHAVIWLDQGRFRAVLDDLVTHVAS